MNHRPNPFETSRSPEQAAFDVALEQSSEQLDAVAQEELRNQAERLEDPDIDEAW